MSADSIIATSGEVQQVCTSIERASRFAFDLEFVSADRYIPELCLIQLCWPGGEPVAIDPLAADIEPVLELVSSPEVTTIAHAAKQDLQLLAERHECESRGLVDTQIAAAFCGLGDQVGLARLVDELCGVQLDKGSQFTDWARRPLSARQMRYALDDVRYLLPIWDDLEGRLSSLERLQWVFDESNLLSASCATIPAADEAFRRVSGARGLTGAALAALRSLAAWRELQARSTNKPPAWLIPDKAMVEAARRGVKSHGDLRRIRGVPSGTVRSYGDDIIGALAQGRSEPPPSVKPRPQPDGIESLQISVLVAVVQAECRRQNLAPRFVGTKSDIEDLVTWFHGDGADDGGGRLMGSWRKELIGDSMMRWMRGELAVIAADDFGLTLSPP